MSEDGRVYFMEIPNTKLAIPQISGINCEVVTKLSENDAKEIISLNDLANKAIKGGADFIPCKTLINIENSTYGEIIVICRIEDQIRGYGYGHIDCPANNGIFYINTIFIAEEFRNRKAAESILLGLINEVVDVNTKNYCYIKAVVHDENNAAKKLILKHGFKKIGD